MRSLPLLSLVIRFFLLPLVTAVSACSFLPAVGPDFQLPPANIPERYAQASEDGVPAQVDWWKSFNDARLTLLIDAALVENQDLKIARSRVQEARAQRTIAEAALYPQLNAGIGYARSKSSDNLIRSSVIAGGGGGAPTARREQDMFQAGFDASWEIDIFGGTRRSVEVAEALEQVSRESYHDVLLTLLSEVARSYYETESLEKRLAITKKNAESQRESLQIAQDRFNSGLSSELDLAQARAQLQTTLAQVPLFEAQVISSRNSLAVLLGRASIDNILPRSEHSPEYVLAQNLPEAILAGTPAEALRNRPDIRAAEQQVRAANALIGAALAERFPKLTLNGSFGLSSLRFDKLFDPDSKRFSFGPILNLPLFTGGRLSAQVEIRNEQEEQAVLAYERTVLLAFAETDSLLSALRKEHDRFRALAAAFLSDQRAVELSRQLYTQGLTDYLRVLDSERASRLSEDALAQSEYAVIRNVIAVYKAIGKGWQIGAPALESITGTSPQSSPGSAPAPQAASS